MDQRRGAFLEFSFRLLLCSYRDLSCPAGTKTTALGMPWLSMLADSGEAFAAVTCMLFA